MGVKGAALATVISQGISCLWCLLFLCSRRSAIRLQAKNMAASPRLILPCVALGLSTFIMQSSESVISVCFNASLLKYGGDVAVGAMTICSSVMQFAMLPIMGVAQGAQPIASYNFGAGNPGRVTQTFRLLLGCCLGYTTLLWLAVMLFPQVFAALFTPDGALVTFASGALRIYLAAVLLMGIQTACQMTFVSIGNAPCSIVVAVVRKFVLLLPFIYLMPALFADKTRAVYMAEPVADVLAVSFTAVLFAFQFRKALTRLEKKGT